MFLSMSTARIEGVTFSGFNLLCNKMWLSHSASEGDQAQWHFRNNLSPLSQTNFTLKESDNFLNFYSSNH